MAYKYSLAHLTVLGCTPHELVYVAARAGYDYISPRPIYMGLPGEPNYALAENPEMMRATKRALADTGIKVHDIELARIYDDMHPTKYLPAMEVAAELGAKAVLSSIWTSKLEYATEKFGEVCDLAKQFEMTVDLEYVPIAGVNTLSGAVKVLRDVDRSNAGLMIDMHHFHRALDKPEDLERLPPEWFHFAHLCDAQGEIPSDRTEFIRIMREERLYIGEGGINIAEILKRLPVQVISIELPHLARAREFGVAEHAFRCIESAKQYISKFMN
jgi:sugar phosphate isomerase/epimerase